MARKQQNDPLRYAANLTALAAAVYSGVTALLRLAVAAPVQQKRYAGKPHCCA